MNSAFPSVSAWIASTSSGGDGGGRRELDVAADVLLAQPGEGQVRRLRLADELREGSDQGIPQHRVDVAVGADDEQPGVVDRSGDELEQEQRRLVRGVHVVEHEHEGLRRPQRSSGER